jgi:formamidopyrimidine-DNA glycosylase
MPELPEVETTRRSLLAWAIGKKIKEVQVRTPRLRHPIPSDLSERLQGHAIETVSRRGKYLIVHIGKEHLLVHLGMSGSLRRNSLQNTHKKHDHVDIIFENGDILRYHDPRRFGLMVWAPDPWDAHPLLSELGVEPLGDDFNGSTLYALTRKRTTAIKPFLMNAQYLVGVGNIYAAEALFRAGIRPTRAAGSLSKTRAERLATEIKTVLEEALASGGSTLRDYVNGLGDPGSFQFNHHVYGRAGQGCDVCGQPIKLIRQSQRATYYCPRCQR